MPELIPKLTNTLKQETLKKRITNIEFIKALPRDGLKYNVHEKRILIHDTLSEKIFIQYPGKESIKTEEKKREYDFRPKLIINNTEIKDLTFKEIWTAIIELSINSSNPHKEDALKLIACEFYRIAYMIDYEEVNENQDYIIQNINGTNKANVKINKKYYKYQPNQKIISDIEKVFPYIFEMSWTALFYYIDLNAQNEDCKYYTSAILIPKKKRKKKNGESTFYEADEYLLKGSGRVNTLSTFIAIISTLIDQSLLPWLLSQFSSKRGIVSLTMENTNKFLKDYMF